MIRIFRKSLESIDHSKSSGSRRPQTTGIHCYTIKWDTSLFLFRAPVCHVGIQPLELGNTFLLSLISLTLYSKLENLCLRFRQTH